MKASLELRTYSLANQREHWAKRAKRAKEERKLGHYLAKIAIAGVPVAFPATITLTRYGTRTLDSDNLAGSFKAIRDGIADRLGVDDGDPCIEWCYKQAKGPYRVSLEITSL